MTKVHVTQFISHELSHLPTAPLDSRETEQKTANDKTAYKYFIVLVGGQVSQLVDHGTHVTEKKENQLGVAETVTACILTFCQTPVWFQSTTDV